jgi:hypothetical protein
MPRAIRRCSSDPGSIDPVEEFSLSTKDLPACPPLDATATAVAVKTTGTSPRLSAVSMGTRRQFPRLKYQHGEFVRSEARQ